VSGYEEEYRKNHLLCIMYYVLGNRLDPRVLRPGYDRSL